MILNLKERGTFDAVVYVDDAGVEHDVQVYYDDDQRYWIQAEGEDRVEVPADAAHQLMAQINRHQSQRRLAALDIGLYGEAP